jgi:hypothetical protein
MKFLLDTDHISILQKQAGAEFAKLTARIAQVSRADLAFCIVSFHEQVLGCNGYIAQAKTPAEVVRGYEISTVCFLPLPQRLCCRSIQRPPPCLIIWSANACASRPWICALHR